MKSQSTLKLQESHAASKEFIGGPADSLTMLHSRQRASQAALYSGEDGQQAPGPELARTLLMQNRHLLTMTQAIRQSTSKSQGLLETNDVDAG